MANHSSPAHSDGQPVSMIPLVDSSFEADDDHQSRSSHHSISPQTRDVPTIDSEYDLGYISTWRAGLIAANGVDLLPSRQLPPRYSAASGASPEGYTSKEVPEHLEPRSRRNTWIGTHAASDSCRGLFPGQFSSLDPLSHDPFVKPPTAGQIRNTQVSNDNVHSPPTYGPEQGSGEYDVSTRRNFPVHTWTEDQHIQQTPLRPTVFRSRSEIEDGGFQAEPRATGILPNLLSLYGSPLTKRRSHSFSTISPSAPVSRANSDSFQTFGMLGLRKRHDSLISANTDANTELGDPDDPREPSTSNHILNKIRLLFRSQTPNIRVTVIRKNVVRALHLRNNDSMALTFSLNQLCQSARITSLNWQKH